MSYDEKRMFLRQQVTRIEKKRKTIKENSRRNNTLEYYIPTDDKNFQVCKAFFFAALCIKERTVMYNLKTDIGFVDKRGKSSHTKFTEDKNVIREHIKSYSAVELHYCRSNSQRMYLDKQLSVKQMYREYCGMCKVNDVKTEKWWLYNETFNSEFNLGFHRPKKDLCSFSESFRHMNKDDQAEKQSEFEMHQNRKNQ